MLSLRRAAATSTLLLLAPLAACGGDGDGDEPAAAPEDASTEEFCEAYSSIFESLLGGSGGTQAEQEQAAVDALQDWAERMEEVGAPEDLPEDARAGFELIIEEAADIQDPEDLQNLEEDYTQEQRDQATALNTWVTENCAGSMPGAPTDAPSSETPSEPSSETATP